MKVSLTAITLETRSGNFGMLVQETAEQIAEAIRVPRAVTHLITLHTPDGRELHVPLKRLQTSIVCMERVEGQVTDSRIALPGMPGVQPAPA